MRMRTGNLYDDLKNKSNPLKKLKIMDIFAIALMYGKKTGIRTEMGKGATGRVRKSTIDSSDLRYLMMAIIDISQMKTNQSIFLLQINNGLLPYL